MSERFFITLFYDIFLVEHIFNIFCHFVIRGGAGDHRKAYLFSYEIRIVSCLFNVLFVTLAHVTHICFSSCLCEISL